MAGSKGMKRLAEEDPPRKSRTLKKTKRQAPLSDTSDSDSGPCRRRKSQKHKSRRARSPSTSDTSSEDATSGSSEDSSGSDNNTSEE